MFLLSSLKAISLLWLGSLLGALFAFLTQAMLARELGLSEYGAVASTLNIVTMAAPLVGFGVAPFLLKIYGEEGWQAQSWLRPAWTLMFCSGGMVLFSLSIWSFVGPHDEQTSALIMIFSFYAIAQAFLEVGSSKLQLEEKYVILALWQLYPHLSRFLLLLLYINIMPHPISGLSAGWIYAAISITVIIFGLLMVKKMSSRDFGLVGHGAKQSDLRGYVSTKSVLSEAWPFGAASFFHLLYFQSYVVLLKYLSSDASAGIYNVAFTILAAVYIFPSVIYQKFLLPKIHRWASQDKVLLYSVYKKGNYLMLMAGLASLFLIWILAPYFIPLAFGEEYKAAIGLVAFLALAVPLRFLSTSSGALLVTKDNMRIKICYMALVGFVSLLLNLLLIPSYGLYGAAAASLVSEVTLLALYLRGVKKHIFNRASE